MSTISRSLLPIRRATWFSLGALCWAVCGCGGGSGSPKTASAADFPAALAQAICAHIGPCCQSAKLPFKQSNCQTVLTQVYKVSLGTGGDAGTYDMASSGACLDSIGSAAGKCDFSGGSTDNSACAAVFSSSSQHSKAGDACDQTCTTTMAMGGTSESCQGTGSSSSASSSSACYTNDGLYCDSSGMCKQQDGFGAACTQDEQCKDGFCGDMATCAALLGVGGDCAFTDTHCQAGLFCDFGSSTCTEPKSEGAACNADVECIMQSCNGGVCDAAAGTQTFLSIACAG